MKKDWIWRMAEGPRLKPLHQPGLELGGDPEKQKAAQEEMEERPRHRVDDSGAPAGWP